LPQECLAALLGEGRKRNWIATNLQNIRMWTWFYNKEPQSIWLRREVQ